MRSLQLKKGDKVKISRGSHKGKTGAIDRVDLKQGKVYLANIEVIKRDGSKAFIPFEPSNLIITEFKSDDKRRDKQLTRGKKTQ